MKEHSFTILVSGGATSSNAHVSALNFVSNAIKLNAAGHSKNPVERVFFYSEGADVANGLRVLLSDELDVTAAWQALQREHELDLSVCIASAERRGVIGELSQADHGLPSENVAKGFRVVGLAEFHDAMLSSSHTVRFA